MHLSSSSIASPMDVPLAPLRSPGDVARGILERDVAWGTRKFGQRAGRGSMARNGHFENGFFFSDLLGEFIIPIYLGSMNLRMLNIVKR